MHGEHNHVCTKCGWSFPNPHPSAKHRRAHKKVCGKLQGFKILEPENNTTHLPVSDVDDDDDEDHSHNNLKEEETRSNNNLKGVMGRQISNRSEGGEEFSDANTEFFYTGSGSSTTTVDAAGITSSAGQDLKATENASLIQPSNNPTDGNQQQSPHALENVEEQMEADTHQDHASSSTMHSVVGSVSDQVAASVTAEMIEATNVSKPEATANKNPENTKNGENTVDSRQVEDTIGESNIDGSKSVTEALAVKTASDSPDDTTILISRPAEGVLDSKEEIVALGLKDPQDEISTGNEDGCSVNESLPAALDHSSVYVDGLSATAANGFKEQVLEKTEPNSIPGTCKAINETEVHLKNPEQTHSDFLVSKSGGTADISPSAVEVLEDNLEPVEMDSKIVVEGQAETSAAKDRISEKFESNGVETFLDTRTSFSHKLQEPDWSQQEKTYDILPETQFVVGADCDATTISPLDSFSGKTDEVKVNIVTEESRIENSGITNSHTGETIEENSTKPTGDCFEVASFLSESEKSIKETESTLENQTELSGMDINENHLANTPESLSNTQVCLDESFQQGSEELEFVSNVDLPSIKKIEVNIVDTNSIIADPVHEETKLNHSSEVGFNQSGAENPIINDFMPSVVDAESCIQCPGKVEENKGKNENSIIDDFTPSVVDAESCIISPGKVEENKGRDFPEASSDVHSQSLQEKVENNILEHKSDASSAMPQDWSVDTISLTDSVEGIWGSVSDGAGPSVKGPNDVPPILVTEVLPGTDTQEPKEATQIAPLEKTLDASEEQNFVNNDIYDAPSFMTLVEPGKGEDQLSASSEIRTAQNPEGPEQPNSSSLQAGWFPSHAHAINESEGRKKNEEIIEKVTKWSSDKEHIPLRSLLVEANVESKHKVKNTQSYGQETDTSTSTQDAVLQAKTVDPPIAATPEATTTHIERDAEKEWNSPARLPISREKRKVRYWAPFLCCSSVN